MHQIQVDMHLRSVDRITLGTKHGTGMVAVNNINSLLYHGPTAKFVGIVKKDVELNYG